MEMRGYAGKVLSSGFVRRTAAILSRTDSKMIPEIIGHVGVIGKITGKSNLN
jgi:hypothetical protein